jgi:hypothetical protein
MPPLARRHELILLLHNRFFFLSPFSRLHLSRSPTSKIHLSPLGLSPSSSVRPLSIPAETAPVLNPHCGLFANLPLSLRTPFRITSRHLTLENSTPAVKAEQPHCTTAHLTIPHLWNPQTRTARVRGSLPRASRFERFMCDVDTDGLMPVCVSLHIPRRGGPNFGTHSIPQNPSSQNRKCQFFNRHQQLLHNSPFSL